MKLNIVVRKTESGNYCISCVQMKCEFYVKESQLAKAIKELVEEFLELQQS